MLLKLNAQAVAKYKMKNEVQNKVTTAQIKDVIKLDLEAMENPEDDFRHVFVEDIEEDLEVEGEAEEVPDDVTMQDVEDAFG